MPLSVPGRSVARTQPAGYLMKNPALPTKGARSTGSARAFGAAIVLGRTIVVLGRSFRAAMVAARARASRLPMPATSARDEAGAGFPDIPVR